MRTPTVAGLGDVVDTLRSWQVAGSPFQLHPGDVGWFWRLGPDATAQALRTWSRDGRVEAVGLLDGPDLLRLALAPALHGDVDLAQSLVADLTADDGRVLTAGEVGVEAPPGAHVHDLLGDVGWELDEPWTLLERDLSGLVERSGLTVLDVGPAEVEAWCAVHLGAFAGPAGARLGLDEMRGRWLAMAEGLPHSGARSLLGVDGDGTTVAAVTVWSAGEGRPGVLEPMGVHLDHHGRGHGRAISLAAAGALRELGSSHALVCAPSSNVAAVATYLSAGLREIGVRRDRRRA